jgi:hypothetical protein
LGAWIPHGNTTARCYVCTVLPKENDKQRSGKKKGPFPFVTLQASNGSTMSPHFGCRQNYLADRSNADDGMLPGHPRETAVVAGWAFYMRVPTLLHVSERERRGAVGGWLGCWGGAVNT